MCTSVQDRFEMDQVLEDNILALLDTGGVKDADDIEDDKLSFIEAVYSLCIAAKEPKAPTQKVHEAIFQILDGNCSMDLNLASYLLLAEIDQQYPRIIVKEAASHNALGIAKELVFNSKIWSPFSVTSRIEKKSGRGLSARKIDTKSSEFEIFLSLLELIQTKIGRKYQDPTFRKEFGDDPGSTNHENMGLMLKFRYLFSILERDFKCRFEVFKEHHKMEVMLKSYVVQLFKEPRRKPLVECLLHLIAAGGVSTNGEAEAMDLNDFCSSIQSILEMVILFDVEYGKRVDASPRKSRQDVQRSSPKVIQYVSRSNPILDLITEIVIYNKSMFADLLQAMADSDCKLKIIFNYFIKNAPKPVVMEMSENPEKMTILELLNCFRELTNAKRTYNCIETDILQVLLSNAFKACLRQTLSCGNNSSNLEECRSLKIAFENLRAISSDFEELHLAAKQALTTADALIALGN